MGDNEFNYKEKVVNVGRLEHYNDTYVAPIYAKKTEQAALEERLSQLEITGGQANVIETVQENGVALPVSNKTVNVTVPTNLTDLNNDGNFVRDGNYVHTDENFTQSLKDKLDGIAPGATLVNVDSALNTSSTNPVQNKIVASALNAKAPAASPVLTGIPSAPTAPLGTNSTQIATTEFVLATVLDAIAGIVSLSYSVVSELPATGELGVVYLIFHEHGVRDEYDEYIWTGNGYERLGNTDVDLSGYMQTSDMIALSDEEINSLF